MLKKAIVVGGVVLAVALAGAAVAGDNGPETVTIILKGGAPGDVAFPHKLHQDKLKECDNCHKLFPQEAGSIAKGVTAHKLNKKDAMKQCVNCHQQTKATGAATGPVNCNGCHKKK